jgi:hypothetical protein
MLTTAVVAIFVSWSPSKTQKPNIFLEYHLNQCLTKTFLRNHLADLNDINLADLNDITCSDWLMFNKKKSQKPLGRFKWYSRNILGFWVFDGDQETKMATTAVVSI